MSNNISDRTAGIFSLNMTDRMTGNSFKDHVRWKWQEEISNNMPDRMADRDSNPKCKSEWQLEISKETCWIEWHIERSNNMPDRTADRRFK
jgi:hypothetical protein